ncbi:MAG: hypothetical protein UT02_C0027G0009 [Parcubacteria group bacterium GW2011_GWC2_38_7]|nr:MAG: hypothetical protein UT02_C0027G0009 [Parcubacteria group bacterium GW2011_GWC2_38_7]
MIETEHKIIEVLVAFMRNKVMPLSFSLNNKKYAVNKVNMVYATRVGRDKWYYFTVSSGDDIYKLGFDTENSHWFLEAAYYNN